MPRFNATTRTLRAETHRRPSYTAQRSRATTPEKDQTVIMARVVTVLDALVDSGIPEPVVYLTAREYTHMRACPRWVPGWNPQVRAIFRQFDAVYYHRDAALLGWFADHCRVTPGHAEARLHGTRRSCTVCRATVWSRAFAIELTRSEIRTLSGFLCTTFGIAPVATRIRPAA